MKNLIFKILAIYFIFITNVFATAPWVVCQWLPWCSNTIWGVWFFAFLWKIISEWIKYVAVVAVISVMISWIMYIVSVWEDEKVKKAKNWIIWSLVWVFISISAWAIINLLNSLKIT